MNFFRISRQIPENSDVCRFSIKFAKTNQKIAENSEICENLFIIIHYFSFVSLLAMRFATEAAISILRIDDLIKLQPPPEEQR